MQNWTQEETAFAKKLWLCAVTAENIAQYLGSPFTKNSVIGKMRRLNLLKVERVSSEFAIIEILKHRPSPRSLITAKPAKQKITTPKAPRTVVSLPNKQRNRTWMPPEVPIEPAQTPVVYVEQKGTATILTLGAHMCKWPIGDPSTEEFSFCGRRSASKGNSGKGKGGRYCIEHARVAYQTKQKKGEPSATPEHARSLRHYI